VRSRTHHITRLYLPISSIADYGTVQMSTFVSQRRVCVTTVTRMRRGGRTREEDACTPIGFASTRRTDAPRSVKESPRAQRVRVPTFIQSQLFERTILYFPLVSHYFSTRSRRRLGARPLVCLAFSAGALPPAKQLSVSSAISLIKRTPFFSKIQS